MLPWLNLLELNYVIFGIYTRSYFASIKQQSTEKKVTLNPKWVIEKNITRKSSKPGALGLSNKCLWMYFVFKNQAKKLQVLAQNF